MAPVPLHHLLDIPHALVRGEVRLDVQVGIRNPPRRDQIGLQTVLHEVAARSALDIGDALRVVGIAKELGDGHGQRVRPAAQSSWLLWFPT